jgi:hypothetical protein
MNFSYKYFGYIFLFVAAVCIKSSCSKKWKKPTDVYFEFQLNSNSNIGLVKFSDGSINLSKVTFTGERSQDVKNIAEDQNFSDNQLIRFELNSTSAGIKFNIPQGTYSKMNIDFATNTNQTESSITINGTYINSVSNDTNAVQLQLLDNQTFNFSAKNSNGGNDMNLIEGHASTITMILNPNYWFGSITSTMLDTSIVDTSTSEHTIFINKNENSNLYNLIISRINESNEAVLK